MIIIGDFLFNFKSLNKSFVKSCEMMSYEKGILDIFETFIKIKQTESN